MDPLARPAARPLGPALKDFLRSFRFRPVLLDAARELNRRSAGRDILAGLVVGITAVPLAIAFAIASGADPGAGLVTAAIAGMLVALFGGSRVQVSGPTGAFVVILYEVTQGHGIDKLFVAVVMAGGLLLVMGLLRLGTIIKYIPYPVTTGFTAGIAVIIFLGQVPHLAGLRLNEAGVAVPADTLGKLAVLANHADRVAWPALAASTATILVILAFRRWQPSVPGPAVALVVLTGITLLWPLQIQTVGSLFAIPQGLPAFAMPRFTLDVVIEMFPAAFAIAMLGAIESLLSAVVADGMAGTRHDSNQELMGQGIANVVAPLFGGIAATGAIARTATNVQNGARSPLAAFVHGAFVLLVLVVAAPWAALVPMAVLAGILAVVAWNMSERHRFAQVLRMPAPDALAMLATFGLTVFLDLSVAVAAGVVIAALLFIGRLARITDVSLSVGESDRVHSQHSLEGRDVPPGVLIYSIDGPFFFGAATRFRDVIDRIGATPQVLILRMRRVPYLDATGLNALVDVVQELRRRGSTVVISAPQAQPMELMVRSGFARLIGDENMRPNIESALAQARTVLGSATAAGAVAEPAEPTGRLGPGEDGPPGPERI